MSLKVFTLDRASGKTILLAVVRMKDGKVQVEKKAASDSLIKTWEGQGIQTAKGHFTLKDGQAFYDNLSLAYSNSTVISVGGA